MCTVVVSFAPEAAVPVLLAGIRDEFADRPWQPPGRHWPDLPVTGGLDLRAGGTWLAVNASVPRAACVLNGWGREPVPASRRRSRGDLPLRAASDGLDAVHKLLSERGALERYDPFHLIVAEPSSVTALSWDGRSLASSDLRPGTHLYTNAGHAYPPSAASAEPEPARQGRIPAADGAVPAADGAVPAADAPAPPADGVVPARQPAPAGERGRREPRAGYFGPRFAAERPSGDARRPLAAAWGRWLGLVAGGGLDASDPRALIVRRELPDGRIWGSSSVSLVSLAARGGASVRYDFRAVRGDTALGDTALGDTAVWDAAVWDTAVGGTAVGGTAVGGTAVGGTAVGGTAVGGGAGGAGGDGAGGGGPAAAEFAWRTVLP